MNKVYLSLGTNKGDNLKQNLARCMEYILQDENVEFIEASSDYKTEPFDMDTKNWFLNKVILINTSYSPIELLKFMQNIERKMGRAEKFDFDLSKKDTKKYLDRVIDIDILSFNDNILNTSELIIPHQKMHERLFVLLPLSEISKDWVHPILKKTATELIESINLNFDIDYKFLKCEKI